MSPLATLIVLGLGAALWFGVLRPRLRGPASKGDGGDAGGAMSDGSRDRHDHDGDGDGGGDGGGSDGGGDGGGD